jgi:hypothetical protein
MEPTAPTPPGLYLRALPDPLVPARCSPRAAARARRLQAFLAPLQRVASARFALYGHTELWVLGPDDWARVTSAPYGWPFTRSRPTPASAAGAAGPSSAVVVAAEVPGRLLQRFEPILLASARQGVYPPTFGTGVSAREAALVRSDVRELFDLVVGHEWGHAFAVAAGLRTRVKWLDELIATCAFFAALHELGHEALQARYLAWARVQVAGAEGALAAEPPRFGRSPRPARPPRRDLGAFETPRGRLRLPELAWFQGMFALRAAELTGAAGWGFLERLANELERVDLRRGSARGRDARGDVARALTLVEPSFRAWFAGFGNRAEPEPDGP